MVRVPRDGLLINVEGVRLENIDFVWDERTPAARQAEPPAILVLEANRCELRRCTFQVVTGQTAPTAIRWIGTSKRRSTDRDFRDIGELVLSNCHVRGLGSAIELRRSGTSSIDISNTLVGDCGALCRLHEFPRLGAAVSLLLEQVTLRDSGPVCAVRCDESSVQPGQLIVRSGGSVLALRDGDPLLALESALPANSLLAFIRWQGEGTLILPDSILAAWQRASGLTRSVDEDLLSAAGLIRGAIEFASDNPLASASSHAISWQAPLRSTQPPGILSGVPDLPLVP